MEGKEMSAIKPRITQAIVRVLQECKGRALPLRALATYANARSGVPAALDDIQLHVSDLQVKGYVEQVASPLNPSSLEYRISELGEQVPLPPDV